MSPRRRRPRPGSGRTGDNLKLYGGDNFDFDRGLATLLACRDAGYSAQPAHPLNIVRYIARRLIFSGLLVLGVSAIIFTLVNAIGNPVQLLMAERPGISEEAVQAMSAYYGLDQPALTRYFTWLAHLAQFD